MREMALALSIIWLVASFPATRYFGTEAMEGCLTRSVVFLAAWMVLTQVTA